MNLTSGHNFLQMLPFLYLGISHILHIHGMRQAFVHPWLTALLIRVRSSCQSDKLPLRRTVFIDYLLYFLSYKRCLIITAMLKVRNNRVTA